MSEYYAKVIIEILVPRYRENGAIQFGVDLFLFSLESHDKSESNYFDGSCRFVPFVGKSKRDVQSLELITKNKNGDGLCED